MTMMILSRFVEFVEPRSGGFSSMLMSASQVITRRVGCLPPAQQSANGTQANVQPFVAQLRETRQEQGELLLKITMPS